MAVLLRESEVYESWQVPRSLARCLFSNGTTFEEGAVVLVERRSARLFLTSMTGAARDYLRSKLYRPDCHADLSAGSNWHRSCGHAARCLAPAWFVVHDMC